MRKHFFIFFTLAIALTRANAQQRPLFDFDPDRPAFKLEKEQLSNKNRFLRASVLTGYREGIKPIDGGFVNFLTYPDSLTGTRRLYMYNLSIEEMLVHSTVWNPPSKVILEVRDPSRYRYDASYGPKDDWIRKNTYCFEYTMPDGVMRLGVPGTFMGMQFEEELQHLFGVKVFREKRKIKVAGKEELEEREFVIIREDGYAK